MPTPPKAVTKRFYPALSDLITLDDLPEFLNFAESGLDVLLSKVFYKNFQYSKSFRGDAAFYSLDVITKNIGIDLPFGMRFVLNPDEEGDSTISSFPISLEYQWEVFAFLKSFDLQNFSADPIAMFNMGLQIFRITEEELIAQTLNYFIEQGPAGESKFQTLVDDINAYYPSANLVLPTGVEITVDLIVQLIKGNANIPADIPQLMFELYIVNSDPSITKNRLQQFYARMAPDGIEGYVKQLLTPKFKTTLKLTAALEFPNTILKPVDAQGEPLPGKTIFKFAEANFFVDTEAGIGTDVALAGTLIPEFNQIGNTGLTIGFELAKLDLSRKTNIPEADAAGYPVDFVGLYVQHATIGFSNFGTPDSTHVSAQITADNFFVGSGGVSGTIYLESGGALYRKFGDFAVELNHFSITFRQNSIISSDIRGKLKISRFKRDGQDAVIDIQVHINDNGDFVITALPQHGVMKLTLPNVLELEIMSISLGKVQRGFYVEVAGKLNFIADLPVLGNVLPKGIDIKRLRIWENGELEFEGGFLNVPKAFKLKVGPVTMEVNNLSMGSYSRVLNGIERSYRTVNFDGMINTGRVGVNATGNGIKFYYTADDNGIDKPFDCFVSIDRIEIDITVPGSPKTIPAETGNPLSQEKVIEKGAIFTLNGYLSVKNPDPVISGGAAQEYSGAVSFSIPRLKLSGSAGMRMRPGIPSFIVDIGLELSSPIPLGATGLGIYGFRGLFGQHYMVSKSAAAGVTENDTWWDYYKAKSTRTGREGVEIDKFANLPGYSMGAGVSFGTSFDSGKVFSSKLFVMLGLPNIFILQGQAGILRARIGLNDDEDPPFSAMIAVDDNSFQGSLGVNYRLPENGNFDGKIVALSGKLDMAFFFNNASGWYVNVGKDQPESARVRAKILTLFNGYAYLMISSRGFKAGAGAKFDFKRRFGPVAVGVGASLEMGGSLSFKPVQIGAFIQVGGYAYVRVFGFGFGLAVQVMLAVEAPHPFNISGRFLFEFKFIKRFKIGIDFIWRFNNDYGPLLAPVKILESPNPAKGYIPATSVNVHSSETFAINHVTAPTSSDPLNIPSPLSGGWSINYGNAEAAKKVTIPLDSFVDIDLIKPVKPRVTKLGGAGNQLPDGYKELMPPQKGLGQQVSHEYELTGLDIYAWRQSDQKWVAYNIYKAVTAIVNGNTGPDAIDLSELKIGYWQFSQPNKYNKIRLFAQNMFSYLNQSNITTSDIDGLNFRRKDVFGFDSVMRESTVNWLDEPLNTVYPNDVSVLIKGVPFTFNTLAASVKVDVLNGKKSLFAEAVAGKVIIKLPKPVTFLTLNFGTNQNNIKIDFAKIEYEPLLYGQMQSKVVYQAPAYVASTQQSAVVTYDNLSTPIDEVILTLQKVNFLDYTGDLIIGGHFALPDAYIGGPPMSKPHLDEVDKTVIYTRLFNKSFTAAEVQAMTYAATTGKVGQWPLETVEDTAGTNEGILGGSPDRTSGFYERGTSSPGIMNDVYAFSGNADSVFVPFAPTLKVENGSFSVDITAIFNPFTAGISTLLSKVKIDPVTGDKKGYALHLYQNTPGGAGTTYTDANVPSFTVWLTCYGGQSSSGVQVSEKYTLDYDTSRLSQKQYRHIVVSVNRTNNTLAVFIDRVLKTSVAIPAELSVVSAGNSLTSITELRYLTEEEHKRRNENPVSRQGMIDELQIMGDNLNKTIQPVWRPNTYFAIVMKTKDTVKFKNSVLGAENVSIFGFKTAGPIGHFHQHNSVYEKLALQDRTAEFKLASLKSYIDYERSYPDAQSRYDLSKPVFYHDPQIALFFVKPYINAMYENWASYQGLPAINSSLELEILDPFGVSINRQLTWEQSEQIIDSNNYQSLPQDQQMLFLMNAAASADADNEHPISFKKKTKKGSYSLPDLSPNSLHTALFNAEYAVDGNQAKAEVHKYNFMTSRFATFVDQAKSFILDSTPGAERYAVYPIKVGFTVTEINDTLKVLIDDNPDNDPDAVLNYAVKFDRLVYGGLKLKNLRPVETSVIELIVNVNPANVNDRRILGVLIRNPEAFNDPKLPLPLLSDTVLATASVGSNQFIYIHSRDTSSVFITNADMNIPVGTMQVRFRYKQFDGEGYQNNDYTSPSIQITTDLLT